ncbi:MAG: type I restriction enzyme endonuclease domain-containing protein [Desulfuromonadales bacterium]
MLKSLREALAQYALGDRENGGEEIVAPIEERVVALKDAIEETERYLLSLGFDASLLIGATGFPRIQALADAVEAVYTSDESKRRFEIMARQVFIRFKGLLMEPSALLFAERHDNIEAIYKKLTERRDTADVNNLLKELHRIVNEAIRAQTGVADPPPESRFYDLSSINLEKLRNEFARKVRRKATALQDIREIVEQKLSDMLKRNPKRMDYYKRYQEIIADYNREKDRVSIEDTFTRLADLAASLDEEQRKVVEEGLTEEEYALFSMLLREDLSKADREQVKVASRSLLKEVQALLKPLEQWTQKEQTQAEVEVFILDHLYPLLPSPPFTDGDKQAVAREVYGYIWNSSASGTAVT